MKTHEAEELIAVIRRFSEADLTPPKVGTLTPPLVMEPKVHVDVKQSPNGDLRHPDTLEWLYRQFRQRMIDDLKVDPIFVKLMTMQPEIEVEVHPQVITLDGGTLKGRVARLLARGWFDSGKRQGETRAELGRTGSDPNSGQLSTLFAEFVSNGFLTRDSGDRYGKALDLKISEKRIEA